VSLEAAAFETQHGCLPPPRWGRRPVQPALRIDSDPIHGLSGRRYDIGRYDIALAHCGQRFSTASCLTATQPPQKVASSCHDGRTPPRQERLGAGYARPCDGGVVSSRSQARTVGRVCLRQTL